MTEITTVEQLEALREQLWPCVFEDKHGNVCVVVQSGFYKAGLTGLRSFHEANLPAKVLHPNPQPSSDEPNSSGYRSGLDSREGNASQSDEREALADVVSSIVENEDAWDEVWEDVFQPSDPTPESLAVRDATGKNWLAWTSEDGDTYARTIPYEGEDEETDVMFVQGITLASSLEYPLTVLHPTPQLPGDADVERMANGIPIDLYYDLDAALSGIAGDVAMTSDGRAMILDALAPMLRAALDGEKS